MGGLRGVDVQANSDSTASLEKTQDSTDTLTVSRNVLVVDDEPQILRAFKRVFRDTNVNLKTAGSVGKALELLGSESYQVVVSDFRMPGMDGIQFLDEVRHQLPGAVRILMSGQADFETMVDVINRVGLFCFLVKPWDAKDLRVSIDSALGQCAAGFKKQHLTKQLALRCSELGELNRTLAEKIQARTSLLLRGLINALDLRDTENQWHSRRVALYSRCVAEQLGLTEEGLLVVEHGALLHDVGKIGVSDTILLKPGELTEEERSEVERHAEYGYRILEGIDFLGNAREIVLQHHERWDGSGYPRKLAGERINIGARIFSIVDTYDAMTTNRPYRRALPHGVACAEINRMRGLLFEPTVVDVWNSIPLDQIEAIRWKLSEPIEDR